MAHEHHGDCCNHVPEAPIEALQQMATTMGRLCCSGQCEHPQHQYYAAEFMLEQHQQAATEQDSTKQKKKKKRRQGWLSLAVDTLDLNTTSN